MLKETEKLELKTSFSEWKEIIISLVAFANRNGGKIVVGVNDTGEFINMQVGKSTIEDFVNKVKQHTDPVLYPSINVKEFGLGEYVEIEIPESDNKPVFAFDKAYIRTRKSNLKISNTSLLELIKRYQTPDFDLQLSNVSLTDKVISKKWILSLNDKHFKIDSNDIEVILNDLGVLQNNFLTQAGYLCFANDISPASNAVIKLARFKGNTPDAFIDMKNTSCNLIESVSESLSFITRSINMNVEIGKQAERIEKWDYPIEALREGLINAIVHRDYSDAGNIQVRIFDDRVEIWSPGLLPRELDLSRIETECRSIPRNKKLAELFFKVNLIENWGTGFIRMLHKCKSNGNPRPVFEEKAGAFVITFYKIKDEVMDEGVNGTLSGILNGTLNGTLNEGRHNVLRFIEQHPGVQAKDIVNQLNLPLDTLNKHLRYLKTHNFIERHGSKKAGGYYICLTQNAPTQKRSNALTQNALTQKRSNAITP